MPRHKNKKQSERHLKRENCFVIKAQCISNGSEGHMQIIGPEKVRRVDIYLGKRNSKDVVFIKSINIDEKELKDLSYYFKRRKFLI